MTPSSGAQISPQKSSTWFHEINNIALVFSESICRNKIVAGEVQIKHGARFFPPSPRMMNDASEQIQMESGSFFSHFFFFFFFFAPDPLRVIFLRSTDGYWNRCNLIPLYCSGYVYWFHSGPLEKWNLPGPRVTGVASNQSEEFSSLNLLAKAELTAPERETSHVFLHLGLKLFRDGSQKMCHCCTNCVKLLI